MSKKIKIPLLTAVASLLLLIASCSSNKNSNHDISKAFHKLEVSIERSGKNLKDDNDRLLKDMEMELEKQQGTAKPWRDKAFQARKYTDKFVLYIDTLKQELLKQYGGRVSSNGGQLKDGANTEAASLYFIDSKEAEGRVLAVNINQTYEEIMGLLWEKDRPKVKTDLHAGDTTEAAMNAWLSETFDEVPLAAAFVILTKYQNEAWKTANDAIGILLLNINEGDYKFDIIVPTIAALSKTIKYGESYTAEIFLAAYDTKRRYHVTVDGEYVAIQDGKGLYKVKAPALGIHKYIVEIRVPEPLTGRERIHRGYGEYNVIR